MWTASKRRTKHITQGLSWPNPPERRVGAMGNPQRAKPPHNIPIFGGPHAAQILVDFLKKAVEIRMLCVESFPTTLELVNTDKYSRRYDRSKMSENFGLPGYRTPTFGEEFAWCFSNEVEILCGQHP